ncbi:hypothetical protein Slin15195_G065760 [Septoria linicola]|uniref:Uncharacterized protein n=1 Tax=Septoria linicola TaxID=215465 RepID=A0A9Q9APD9_9PEZI|nr:hypothetical protein Slin14017_G116100 [Septoria linicola]USW53257.1 hypothetical protein Slin15195_G065760 [Septoria linicola]
MTSTTTYTIATLPTGLTTSASPSSTIAALPTVFTTSVSTLSTIAALTTIFTPPSSCLQRTYTLSGQDGRFTDFTDKGSDGSTLTIYRGYSTECFPPEATLSDGWVQFSPGLCPSAYSIASIWSGGIGFTETFATCCPWYMHASSSYYDCGSFPESTSVVLTGASDGSVVTSSGYAFDTPIFIRWRSEDLSWLERHPTATGSWNVATDIQAPLMADSTETVPTPSVEPEPESTGLSTGAKAGIGVGVSLGVLVVLAIVTLTMWRRRKAKKQRHVPVAASNEHNELADDGKIHQIDSAVEVFETSGERKVHKDRNLPAEVEGDNVAELDAHAGAERQKDVTRTGTAELEGDVPVHRGPR